MPTVMIYSKDGTAVADLCSGPQWSSACPRAEPGKVVACAGSRIIVIGARGEPELELTVEPDATVCPLAAFNLPCLGDGDAGGALAG